jgi:putative transposase
LFASRWNRRLPFELVLQAVSSGTVVGLGSVLTRMLGLCFEKAIAGNGVPETVTIDKSGANFAGLNAINADREVPIKIRQSKYLNNVVEQDHRAIKRIVRPMLGFKSFRCARVILGGIELMHMIAKGQMKSDGGGHRSVAEQFYDLAK